MKIAGIVPFAEESTILADNKYFRSNIPHSDDLEIFYTGSIVPGETKSDVVDDMGRTMQVIKEVERDGFDAVVLFPHFDLGLDEARELVRIPVMGATQTALHIGGMLGHRICSISPILPLMRGVQHKARQYGLDHMVTCRSMGISANGILPYYAEYLKTGKYGEVLDRLVEVSIKAIEEDDVSVLTSGCGAMLWLVSAAEKELKAIGYNVPFINPVPTMLEIARAFVNLGLTHSKLAYPGFEWEHGSPKLVDNPQE